MTGVSIHRSWNSRRWSNFWKGWVWLGRKKKLLKRSSVWRIGWWKRRQDDNFDYIDIDTELLFSFRRADSTSLLHYYSNSISQDDWPRTSKIKSDPWRFHHLSKNRLRALTSIHRTDLTTNRWPSSSLKFQFPVSTDFGVLDKQMR